METEKKENPLNEESNLRAAELADLPVTDEQAQQTKGGEDQFALNYAKVKVNY